MTKTPYTKEEIKLFRKLNTPQKIQEYLSSLPFNFSEDGFFSSPRMVIKNNSADCLEGAIFAAAVLEFHGQKPLVLDLRSMRKPFDYDHVVAVFKKFNSYGAISKTNHAVLRYREPVYKTTRELVMSYFHEYFLQNGTKTLREYSEPFDLSSVKHFDWRTTSEDLWEIHEVLDKLKHFKILSKKQAQNLRKADSVEIEAGKIVVETQN
ncbi:MAG: hypothetical protein A2566_03625 [Candidatus Zambryskibacteria bacterium RIFOXYD1_FULL_40_13]|nr:MAG: hypothetical protein UT25_C0002G0201 [Parcubacteria group bacterium GW2011_GWC1_39_12]KKR19299.1 MAG: hypothetical protein UT49_C0002G0145 [Parcubacteria group bacterium GW2011_GWF1_39_37]KKR35318.1 MAG: hypothetical protein UT68_C0004G0126 [Parcubacteria group bacterium GW2011_GWC2_40_10]KKR52250.1 MAG: hypothetical protein UT89_C0002G0051 [Parcubacteria group bacterium GW2011_GWE1_40_20]KKR65002.1 MAG: hypothetical protein UU06_C0032G0006 [Parcubacteria group bacterium GW2011_GWB1_40_